MFVNLVVTQPILGLNSQLITPLQLELNPEIFDYATIFPRPVVKEDIAPAVIVTTRTVAHTPPISNTLIHRNVDKLDFTNATLPTKC